MLHSISSTNKFACIHTSSSRISLEHAGVFCAAHDVFRNFFNTLRTGVRYIRT